MRNQARGTLRSRWLICTILPGYPHYEKGKSICLNFPNRISGYFLRDRYHPLFVIHSHLLRLRVTYYELRFSDPGLCVTRLFSSSLPPASHTNPKGSACRREGG